MAQRRVVASRTIDAALLGEAIADERLGIPGMLGPDALDAVTEVKHMFISTDS